MQKSWKNPNKRCRELVKRLPKVTKALNAGMKKAPPIVTKEVDAPFVLMQMLGICFNQEN